MVPALINVIDVYIMALLHQIEKDKPPTASTFIFFLGQSGYILRTPETILYIDPYLSNYVQDPSGLGASEMIRSFPPPIIPEEINTLNGILCTHAHVDHMDPWTIMNINADFMLYTSVGAYEQNPVELPQRQVCFLEPGITQTINDVFVESLPAAHYDLHDHLGRPDCLSFVITVHQKIIFLWGDGIIYPGLVDKLQQYSFDYFFAPINGRDKVREAKGIVGNLKALELAQLCCDIHIRTVVPNHYDMFKVNTASVDYFLECVATHCPDQDVHVLSCGDHLEV